MEVAMVMVMAMVVAMVVAMVTRMTMVSMVSRSSQGESGRDILVFHCEFSSQRGPDFYKKLRYQY